jgi:hypothetical protein
MMPIAKLSHGSLATRRIGTKVPTLHFQQAWMNSKVVIIQLASLWDKKSLHCPHSVYPASHLIIQSTHTVESWATLGK